MSRPVEQVLADVITAASPISEELPPELQTDMDALAQQSDAELWEVAKRVFPANRRREYDRLLEKNSTGTLTPAERDRLTELRLESERLMLHKAHAYALLKWRGHTLPALTKIARPVTRHRKSKATGVMAASFTETISCASSLTYPTWPRIVSG
ncbi:hypothetical protein L0337_28210 [candidate division KSB1 bacterium]|nr:hypothetical protein [candidate division KSB1 bacterium]